MRRAIRKDYEILALAALFQLVLLAAFLAGWVMQDELQARVHPEAAQSQPAPPPPGTAAVSKGDMAASVVQMSAPPPPPAVTELTTGSLAPEAPDIVSGPEEEGTATVGALLTMDGAGKLRIGNYEPVTLEGSAEQCLGMGRMLLTDAGAREDELEVMARSKAITVARICAVNGSVVITCRRNQITISPRQLKPNESCGS